MLTGKHGSALAVVGVLAAAGLAQTGPGHAALRSLGLLKAASYTALAFGDPQSLPSHYPARRSELPISFSIRDVSDSDRVYDWAIVLSAGSRSKQVAAGETPVSAGTTATVGRTVTVVCPRPRAHQRRKGTRSKDRSGSANHAPLTAPKRLHLIVRLASPAESIGFWASCPAKKGPKNNG